MKGNYHDLELCIVLNLDDILQLYYEDGILDDLYFCGRFSRVPYTDAERRYAAAVTQLFDYVKLGNRRAAFFFFLNIGKNGPVLLNPDIEYYLRGLLPPAYEMDDGLDDTSHLEPLLTAERKAFLDAAIARRDFDSVLKTSPPCPPRERLWRREALIGRVGRSHTGAKSVELADIDETAGDRGGDRHGG